MKMVLPEKAQSCTSVSSIFENIYAATITGPEWADVLKPSPWEWLPALPTNSGPWDIKDWETSGRESKHFRAYLSPFHENSIVD